MWSGNVVDIESNYMSGGTYWTGEVNMTLVTCHFNEANFIRNFRCMSLALQYCQATYTSMLSDFAKLICVVKVNTMKIKAGKQMTKRVNNSQTIAEFRPGHRSVTNKKSGL
uniref:Uncharacterized protein n=1 Tax=Glossina palpalis gambiensis TaxID=67801 RepID=A0A1B0AYK2_9MUSC